MTEDDDLILVQPGGEGWPELCVACHTNGGRATQQQMEARRLALWTLTQEFQPATVRQTQESPDPAPETSSEPLPKAA